MTQHAEPALPPAAGAVLPGAEGAPIALPWPATWILLLVAAAVLNGALVFFAHGVRGFFLPMLALVVCVLAAVFDGWTWRIPNQLTYVAILLGLGLNGLVPVLDYFHWSAGVALLGSGGLAASLYGFGVCAAATVVLGVLTSFVGDVNLGDLKLLTAVGAMVGFWNVCSIAMLALFFALGYGLINLAMLGRLNMMLRVAMQRVVELIYFRRVQTPVPEGRKATHFPMGIPLAAAVMASIYLQVRYGRGSVL